jgi:hypothetical protein
MTWTDLLGAELGLASHPGHGRRLAVGLMTFVHDDGGRVAAGFKGHAGDCVVRAIAIATGIPYRQV